MIIKYILLMDMNEYDKIEFEENEENNYITFIPLEKNLYNFLTKLYELFDNIMNRNIKNFKITIKEQNFDFLNNYNIEHRLITKFKINIYFADVHRIKYYINNLIINNPNKYNIFKLSINDNKLIITNN